MLQNKLMIRALKFVNTSRDLDMSFDVMIPKGTFLQSKSSVEWSGILENGCVSIRKYYRGKVTE